MRNYIAAKIHDLRVTQRSVQYHGSVSIDGELLAVANIHSYEQVHVVNLANGNRWITYVLPGDQGQFSLNGGGAHLGDIGDACVVMSYRWADSFDQAIVVFCDENNRIRDKVIYVCS